MITSYADIRDAVARLCARFPGEYWRALDRDMRYPSEFVDALTEAGWLSVLIPEQYGGAGLPLSAAAAILEQIQHEGCNGGACHAQIYTMGTLLRHGSDEQKQHYLPDIAAGRLRLQAFGVTEPGSGTDTGALRTSARREGEEFVVNGQKIWTSRAEHSDLMMLLARTEPLTEGMKKTAGLSVLMVDMREATGKGLSIRPIRTMMNHATTEVFFDDLRVPARNLIGEQGEGFRYILSGMNAERILIAAECVGDAKWFIDKAVAYASEREVFAITAKVIAGLGEYVVNEKGYKTVATVGEDYSFVYTQVLGFALGFCQAGGEITERFWVPLGTKDFGSIIAALPDDVDAIYLGLGGGDAVNFLNQYQQAGGSAQLIGGTIMVDGTVLNSKGKAKEALIGVPSSGPQADTSDDPKWQAYVASYLETNPDDAFPIPSLLATGYYNATNAMISGLNAVDGDLSDGHAALREALTGMSLDAPNGTITLDENRQAIGTNFVNEVVQLEDGSLATENMVVVEGVTQTLGLEAAAFASIGLPSRDAPECKASY